MRFLGSLYIPGNVTGGVNSGDTLTLSSTSHATKGKIILGSASAYDEVNDRLGLGTTSPGVKLDITSAASTKMRSNSAAGSQATIVLRDGGTDKWEFGKQTDNTFFLYNSGTAKVALSISGNDVTMNASSAGNTYLATKARIGGFGAPTYECDVTGTVNASTGYRIGGVAGYTGTITSGLFSSITVSGGIITAVGP